MSLKVFSTTFPTPKTKSMLENLTHWRLKPPHQLRVQQTQSPTNTTNHLPFTKQLPYCSHSAGKLWPSPPEWRMQCLNIWPLSSVFRPFTYNNDRAQNNPLLFSSEKLTAISFLPPERVFFR